jgi:predicted esterase
MAAAGWQLGCGDDGPAQPPVATNDGRLQAAWAAPTTTLGPGVHELGLGAFRDGYLRLPEGYDAATPAPLSLFLHGAGGDAYDWEGGFPLFDELGMAVLAVDSRDASWDLRYGAFGPDVAFIDSALEQTFARCHVDATRLGIAGFSDGASYALSVGLTNGDLFTHVFGFSPGFVETEQRNGTPPVFLSHGTDDQVLPVGFSRGLADQLRSPGHEVLFEVFAGGHVIPYAIAEAALQWLVEGEA